MKHRKSLILLLMLSLAFSLSAQRVTLSFKNQKLANVLSSISRQTGLSLAYSSRFVDLNKKVSISANSEKVTDVLNRLLNNTQIGYEIQGKEIFLFRKTSKSIPKKVKEAVPKSQKSVLNGLIKGIVSNERGEPVVGANVIVKGTDKGTITDADGVYALNDVPVGNILTISCTGYDEQDVKLRGESYIRTILHENNQLLNEIVVVGYGTQKKEDLTGAISTVDIGKTMEARPTNNVSKALQGVVPGLSIINTNGGINANPDVTIRGVGTVTQGGSIAPLYVVDGVPMSDISVLNPADIATVSVLKDAASTSIYGTRAAFGVVLITTKAGKKTGKLSIDYTNNFAWDTPTVLPNYPDVPTQLNALITASARTGTPAQLFGMDLNSLLPLAQDWEKRHGWKKAGYRPMVAGDDYTVNANGSGALYFADWDVKNIMIRQWTPSQTHDLSIQGSSGKTTYYLSFGYNNTEGVLNFNPDKLQKYNSVINISSDITPWLQIGGRLNWSDKEYTTPHVRRGTYTYMWRWGSFFGPYGTINGYDTQTDISYLKQAGMDRTSSPYTRLGTFLKITPFKGMTVNADYTYSLLTSDRKIEALPVFGYNTWGGNLSAPSYFWSQASTYFQQSYTKDRSYALNLYGNYAFHFDKNNFNAMLGANQEEDETYYFLAQRMGLLSNSQPEFPLSTGTQTVNGSHTHWGTAGYFGRLNYNYADKYLLEVNERYDGSSRFPQNDHWAWFPSASLGYIFSSEKYFERLQKAVNYGKIRVSFGEIGNQEIGPYKFLSTISGIAPTNVNWLDASGNLVTEYGLPTLVASSLKWERIQTLDFGLDLGFMNDFNLTGDWYQRSNLSMLAPGKTFPDVLGDLSPMINAGSLRTRGWELSLNWQHVYSKNLLLYANFNIGDYSTYVTKWNNDVKLINSYYSGERLGDIWGFVTDRYFTKNDFTYDASGHITGYAKGVASQSLLEQGSFHYGPGDVKFKDLNGDGVIDGGKGTADDHGDLRVIGNNTPRYQYGFRLGGSFKGFDLDLFFEGVGKRDVWTQSAFVMPLMRGLDAIYANQTSYWTESNPDPNAKFPNLYPSNAGLGNISGLLLGNHNFYPQSKYLVNMAYLRIKNLTLGYTLPLKWTQKAYIQKLRFYFSASNLGELINKSNAPIDPEINASEGGTDLGNGTWGRIAPITRTISFGVQLSL